MATGGRGKGKKAAELGCSAKTAVPPRLGRPATEGAVRAVDLAAPEPQAARATAAARPPRRRRPVRLGPTALGWEPGGKARVFTALPPAEARHCRGRHRARERGYLRGAAWGRERPGGRGQRRSPDGRGRTPGRARGAGSSARPVDKVAKAWSTRSGRWARPWVANHTSAAEWRQDRAARATRRGASSPGSWPSRLPTSAARALTQAAWSPRLWDSREGVSVMRRYTRKSRLRISS